MMRTMSVVILRGVVASLLVIAALAVGDQLRTSRAQLATGQAATAATARASPPANTTARATLAVPAAAGKPPPATPSSAPPRKVVPTPVRTPFTGTMTILTGTVSTGSTPVRGAEVVVYPADSFNRGPTPMPPDHGRALTDDRGGYRIALPPGTYRVGAFRTTDASKVFSDGYTWVTWYGGAYAIGLGADLEVRGDTTVADIAMLRSVQIAGRVVGRDGVGVPNAQVSLMRDVNGIQFAFGGGASDPAGRFSLSHVAMRVTLSVTVSGRSAPAWTTLDVDLRSDRTDLVVTLDRGHIVSGTLRDAAGRPLVNTFFGAVPTDSQVYCSCNARSDDAGRFSLTIPTANVRFRTWPSRPGDAELLSKEYAVTGDIALDPVLEAR